MVWNDVVQQALIVGDDDERAVLPPERVDACRHRLQRVDVEPGVRLVQHREPGLEHRHLENLVPLLLAAREALVDRAPQQGLVDVDQAGALAQQLQEVHRVEFRLAPRLAVRVDRRLQEVAVADAGDLDRILEGQEEAGVGPLFRRHLLQVLAVELQRARSDLVVLLARENLGQRALARAVRPHHGVNFARADLEIHTLQDFLFFDLRVKVTHPQHCCISPCGGLPAACGSGQPGAPPMRVSRRCPRGSPRAASVPPRRTPSGVRETLPCRTR